MNTMRHFLSVGGIKNVLVSRHITLTFKSHISQRFWTKSTTKKHPSTNLAIVWEKILKGDGSKRIEGDVNVCLAKTQA